MDRRTFLHIGLAGLTGPAFASAPDVSVRPALRPADAARRSAPSAEGLIAQADLGGRTSFVVSDARTGAVLEAVSPLSALPPASVAKVPTALYALETLGPDHRFQTRLVARGRLLNGRLDGDLVLVGGGDPTLDTDDLAQLAAMAKSAGLREVSGRFLVDGSALPQIDMIDTDQPDHVGYNPAISGLGLNFNRVYFEWRRASGGYALSVDARSDRLRPAVEVARVQIANREAPVFRYARRRQRDEWTVARSALGNAGGRWLPVRNPPLYAGDVMRTLLRSHGIVVAPAVDGRTQGGTVLAAVQSPPLAEMVRDMLRFSTNLTAECLGLTATRQRGGGANSLRASGRTMEAWLQARCGVSGSRFHDHSGLNDESRVSTRDLVDILVAQGVQSGVEPLMRRIDLRGADGQTLRRPALALQAKTGTLNFTSALAGYARAQNGRTLAFAVVSADLPRRSRIAKADRESPPGARNWDRRARQLTMDLLRRWGAVHVG